ncbi:hypothetical protein Tco_0783542 [Tanacetum coccineum]
MLIEESDNLNILDADQIDPALEASSLSKFDMHLHKSSLSKTHVKWLTKCYGIPEDLHLRVVPEGTTMDVLPNDAIGLYRAAPIAMAWRHHDFSVADPFPKAGEINESNVAKLRKIVIVLRKSPPSLLYVACLSNTWKHASHSFSLKDLKGKVITMAEFLRLPNFKGCKVAVETLLPPGIARVTYLTPATEWIKNIPPKIGDIKIAEIPSRMALDKKEKKKRKAEANSLRALPFPCLNTEKHATVKEIGHELVDPHLINEGHSDNANGIFGLRSQPSPLKRSDHHVEFVERPMHDKVTPLDVSVICPSPFPPQWGLTDSNHMDTSRVCQDMMSNLFTPADNEFFNEVVQNEHEDLLQGIQERVVTTPVSFDENVFTYNHLSQDYDGALTREKGLQVRVEELEREKVEVEEVCAKQVDRIKQLKDELKQSEIDTHQLRLDREIFVVECGNGEMVRHYIINEYLPTFVRRLHQSAEYKLSLGEDFSLAIGKGFMDGTSIRRKDEDIQAILAATPNMDPISSITFKEKYERLFDKRYPYVDKVARAYLLDLIGLDNAQIEYIFRSLAKVKESKEMMNKRSINKELCMYKEFLTNASFVKYIRKDKVIKLAVQRLKDNAQDEKQRRKYKATSIDYVWNKMCSRPKAAKSSFRPSQQQAINSSRRLNVSEWSPSKSNALSVPLRYVYKEWCLEFFSTLWVDEKIKVENITSEAWANVLWYHNTYLFDRAAGKGVLVK